MLAGITFTILTGLCFLIGIIIVNNVKNKEKMSLFTISLAFVTMAGLLIFDLLAEIIAIHKIWILVPLIFGFLLITILDKLIPHHHNHHTEKESKKEHNLHLNHIGIITIIALTIHNLLEGLTLYSVTLNSFKSGLLMMISISLHNIPLGFQIGNSIKQKKNNIWLIILLCLSSFLGSLIIICFGNLNEFIENIFLAITFGMLLYILIFELFGEIKASIKQKETIYGIIVGIVILIITFLV